MAKIKWNAYVKNFVLLMKPHLFLGTVQSFLLLLSNLSQLSLWISRQKKTGILNDFYSFKRVNSKRFDLYSYFFNSLQLEQEEINYLEFGVYNGESFKWWTTHNLHKKSRFYGFDTFEGLPEKWGIYKKGEMFADIPKLNDDRVLFIKGLFQKTLFTFLKQSLLNEGKRNIIHLDADLFSSTLFILTTMAPYLKRGDILIFDEFNVPNHEFFAYRIFCESFYIKPKLLGSVNNYFQVAFIIE